MGRVKGTAGRRFGAAPGAFRTATKGSGGRPKRGSHPRRRSRRFVPALVGLAFLGVGLVLLVNAFLVSNRGDAATSHRIPSSPEDKTLILTIPEMARISRDTVPDAAVGDEGALKRSAAVHIRGTGFPWQRGANVYLAGHRLGYPRTESWLTFWNLNKLEGGDRVRLTDASGMRYTYRVFEKFVVSPDDSWVKEPVPGKNVVTLQTCTLPDYSQRLIVRAELVDTRRREAQDPGAMRPRVGS